MMNFHGKRKKRLKNGEDPLIEASSPKRKDTNHEKAKTKGTKTKSLAPLAKRLCTRLLIEFRRVRLPCGADITKSRNTHLSPNGRAADS